jgi:hypothetical protein
MTIDTRRAIEIAIIRADRERRIADRLAIAAERKAVKHPRK